MKTIEGYKFIQKDMKSQNGNHKWKLGKWYKEDKIKLCELGFHACIKPLESLAYIYGDKWFLVEARGKIIKEKGDKFVASEMRLVREIPLDKVVKRFALWCSKQYLKNYEKEYPQDFRVSDCIKATEDYLDNKISLDELSIARSAAGSAARSAAWSAAESAAGSAARSAAESAAESAQNKQLKKLIQNEFRI